MSGLHLRKRSELPFKGIPIGICRTQQGNTVANISHRHSYMRWSKMEGRGIKRWVVGPYSYADALTFRVSSTRRAVNSMPKTVMLNWEEKWIRKWIINPDCSFDGSAAGSSDIQINELTSRGFHLGHMDVPFAGWAARCFGDGQEAVMEFHHLPQEQKLGYKNATGAKRRNDFFATVIHQGKPPALASANYLGTFFLMLDALEGGWLYLHKPRRFLCIHALISSAYEGQTAFAPKIIPPLWQRRTQLDAPDETTATVDGTEADPA
ncbi:hypothetical protein BC827DRAFT_1156198 [Russula dissimulans]|nr:hypothetical protein BC827DRAFT_1156198 [Russula dissimulans]